MPMREPRSCDIGKISANNVSVLRCARPMTILLMKIHVRILIPLLLFSVSVYILSNFILHTLQQAKKFMTSRDTLRHV